MNFKVDAWRWLLWLCLPVVPLGCLVWEAVRWTSLTLYYPQHFNDHCAQFGAFYGSGAASLSNLMTGNAIILSPAILLILLWRQRYVILSCAIVCYFCAPFLSEVISNELTGRVNCYRDIGLGVTMTALFLMVQTFILLVILLIAGGRLLIRWLGREPPMSVRPSAP